MKKITDAFSIIVIVSLSLLVSCSDSSQTTTPSGNDTTSHSSNGSMSLILNHTDTLNTTGGLVIYDTSAGAMHWTLLVKGKCFVKMFMAADHIPINGETLRGVRSIWLNFKDPFVNYTSGPQDTFTVTFTSIDLANHKISMTFAEKPNDPYGYIIDHGIVTNAYLDILPDKTTSFSCTVNDVPFPKTGSRMIDSYANRTFDGGGQTLIQLSYNDKAMSFYIIPQSIKPGTYTIGGKTQGTNANGTVVMGQPGNERDVLYQTIPDMGAGTITLTDVDSVKHRLSGTFDFWATCAQTGEVLTFKNGVFTNIPFEESGY